MCAQGVNWKTAQPYTTTAKNNSETFVFGCENETIVGEKTETVSALWLVGVLGLKAEVVVGAQIGIQVGFKGEWTSGYKYDRVPLGQVEIVGDHVGSHGSHTTSVGTSFFVDAETSAKISSQNLILTSTAELSAAVPGSPQQNFQAGYVGSSGWVPPVPYVAPVAAVAAVNNTSTLSLLPTQASLIAGQNTTTNTSPASLFLTQGGATLTGITAGNLVSILAAALLINHATSVCLGTSEANSVTATDGVGVNITGTPGVILNGVTDGVSCNGDIIKLGQPPVIPATYGTALTDAQTAATTAATAAEQALAASYP